MLTIILLSATIGLPITAIYFYQTRVLKKNYTFTRNDLLVPSVAALLQLAASHLPYYVLERLPANFIHHAVGGGVVVAIITMYVQKRLWPTWALWQQFALVLAAANILGNANEILELLLELTTGTHYIVTKLDTNIDLVANNVGALGGFFIILALGYTGRRLKK